MSAANLDSNLEYAIELADLDFSHEYEDLFKLASLCQEIAEAKSKGVSGNPTIEAKFLAKIKDFYAKRGVFRSEIEKLPLAKQFIGTT